MVEIKDISVGDYVIVKDMNELSKINNGEYLDYIDSDAILFLKHVAGKKFKVTRAFESRIYINDTSAERLYNYLSEHEIRKVCKPSEFLKLDECLFEI